MEALFLFFSYESDEVRFLSIFINISSLPYAQRKYNQLIVFYMTDQSIIADPVSPLSFSVRCMLLQGRF